MAFRHIENFPKLLCVRRGNQVVNVHLRLNIFVYDDIDIHNVLINEHQHYFSLKCVWGVFNMNFEAVKLTCNIALSCVNKEKNMNM